MAVRSLQRELVRSGGAKRQAVIAGKVRRLRKELATQLKRKPPTAAEWLQKESARKQAELGADADDRIINRMINEALLDLSPDTLLVVRHTAANAAEERKPTKTGRPRDYARHWVIKAFANAHLALFGFAPRRLTGDRDPETPSVLWISKVLKGHRLKELSSSGGYRPPEVVTLISIAADTPRNISKILGELDKAP